jgi:hypothetical protein
MIPDEAEVSQAREMRCAGSVLNGVREFKSGGKPPTLKHMSRHRKRGLWAII